MHRACRRNILAIMLLALALGCSDTSGDSTSGGSGSGAAASDDEWMALVDAADAEEFVHDEEVLPVKLADFSAESRPSTKLIMVVAAAGWCSPCQGEAAALNEFAADYADRGVAVMTAVIQDASAKRADESFARDWAENFSLKVPVLIDTEFLTDKYFDLAQMPATLLIDAKSMKVLTVEVGADTGKDPLGKYRDLVDFHLSKS